MTSRTRRYTLYLLGTAVVIGSFLLPPSRRTTATMGYLSAVSPVQRTLARASRTVASGLGRVLPARNNGEQNGLPPAAELIEHLARERAYRHEYERRLEMLGAFVRHRDSLDACQPAPVAEAEVIARGAGPDGDVVFIDRGGRHGVRDRMVILAGQSVVGTVYATGPTVSAALLPTSIGSRFAGLLIPAGAPDAEPEPGIVVGQGDGTMKMKYITRRRPEVGDQVVTDGRDGTVPKHLLIGRVAQVRREPGQLVYDVTVSPVRDLDRLVTVIVATPTTTREEFPELE